MGKQYNKIQKRRRRTRYLKRKAVAEQQPKPAGKAA
jgi:hypothetical protein